jgi:hypothetical protein
VHCGPTSFGFVDPFPSIEAGQPGKRCQFIDASQIPADHMNMTIPFTAAEDRIFDDTSLNVNVEFAVEKASGGRVFRNFMLLSADFVKELIEDTFQGTLVPIVRLEVVRERRKGSQALVRVQHHHALRLDGQRHVEGAQAQG